MTESLKVVEFSGQITSTSRDGRSGVVSLERAVQGKKFAVISPETKGRIGLMNGKGFLEPGTRVTGSAEVGSEALRAVVISAT